MNGRRTEPDDLVGLVRVRQHCTFTWRKAAHQDQRSVEVFGNHCADCVEEVRRRGYSLVFTDPERPS
jgi:hypothetical protein